MQFEFDWDPAKAESNLRKHGVAFERAMSIFSDPLALSLLDDDSGAGEGLPWDVLLLMSCCWPFIPIWSWRQIA
ncbi:MULTISPECIES: BrnT family toxin [unclassified Bradyrhizobium]|uniref:BrnT family toxin n=1 Tax=unclassified Bradyrhizobium TaxID=2631580 RepID=UPI0028E20734|nr:MULTISPECIES: BrnT family toxin [unclassified Bradyrhizobium]